MMGYVFVLNIIVCNQLLTQYHRGVFDSTESQSTDELESNCLTYGGLIKINRNNIPSILISRLEFLLQ